MKSLFASVRLGGGIDRVDHAVQFLEDEWRKHGDVQLERLWTEQKRALAVDPDQSMVLLTELIRTDLRCRSARGQSPTVAAYLEQFPDLAVADSRVLSLIYEEFCLAEERGAAIDVESFCDRYPRWKDSLVSQLQYHRLFSQAAGPRVEAVPFPEPGDTFEEFQLDSLLGRGGTSRVFLARDLSLGGKQVVLKVSLDRGQEPKAQGALDHPHIVPVNSVVFGERQLRGLSMPFRPGLPLDEVIKRVDPAARPRRALALWQALVQGTDVLPTAPAHEGPDSVSGVADGRADLPRGDGWDGFPTRGTYAEGVAWIVMILARALDYAHGMRTFHRDVKPGNVLLTLHHGPQLLDFNLAESPHTASRAEAAIHGGTLPYMAPEQIEAFLNPELWGKVGAKADIYSLGLVLRELLTGQAPDLPAQTLSPPRALRMLLDRRPMLDVSVRRINPAIPHALEAIVEKCLAIPPEARYPDAQALGTDLDRFLKRLPLVCTTNPSRPERLGNWARRRRWALATNAAYLLLIAGLVFGVVDRVQQWIKPAVETVSTFLDAVREIDNAEFNRAEPSLRRFVTEYPEAFLPKLYLSFALDGWNENKPGVLGDTGRPIESVDPARGGGEADDHLTPPMKTLKGRTVSLAKREGEADDLLTKVMEAPNVRDRLVAWARDHPEVASHLEAAGQARFAHVERITKRNDYDPQRAELERRSLFDLARPALELAAELNPKSTVAPRLLAIIEEFYEHYEPAYARISLLIDAARVPGHDELELYRDTTVRARLATKWADQLKCNPGADRQALGLIEQAVKDLDFSQRYVATHGNDTDRTLYVLANKPPAFLTLSEIEADLGMIPEAKKDLRVVLETLDEIARLRKHSVQYKHYWLLPRYQQRAAKLTKRLEMTSFGGSAQEDLNRKPPPLPSESQGAPRALRDTWFMNARSVPSVSTLCRI